MLKPVINNATIVKGTVCNHNSPYNNLTRKDLHNSNEQYQTNNIQIKLNHFLQLINYDKASFAKKKIPYDVFKKGKK